MTGRRTLRPQTQYGKDHVRPIVSESKARRRHEADVSFSGASTSSCTTRSPVEAGSWRSTTKRQVGRRRICPPLKSPHSQTRFQSHVPVFSWCKSGKWGRLGSMKYLLVDNELGLSAMSRIDIGTWFVPHHGDQDFAVAECTRDTEHIRERVRNPENCKGFLCLVSKAFLAKFAVLPAASTRQIFLAVH